MKNNPLFAALFFVLPIPLLFSCTKPGNPANNNNNTTYETVTDIDGNIYHVVIIGNQKWLKENLKVQHFRDGTAIPYIADANVWTSMTTPGLCYYYDSLDYFDEYGALYNWYAAADTKNIAPTGWHVATDADWTTLSSFLGGDNNSGCKLKEDGYSHWTKPNNGANNASGFTALPGGLCEYYDGNFYLAWKYGYWWTSTSNNTKTAWVRNLRCDQSALQTYTYDKHAGYSIRCVKD
jgi:uncharacterized protein (TIGR02145 family)